MEEKIATWSVAVFVAGFVALLIYGCVMDFYDAETIRVAAESGIIFVALGLFLLFSTAERQAWRTNVFIPP